MVGMLRYNLNVSARDLVLTNVKIISSVFLIKIFPSGGTLP